MGKRGTIGAGMAAGALWAVALVWGVQSAGYAYLPPQLTLPGALAMPGLVLAAIIGRIAQRRFSDDALIDGGGAAPGSPAWIDGRVLVNTVEQALLAALIWPFVAMTLGGVLALYLGGGFVVARLAFWVGYHVAPPLRAFGFAATFYPTVLAGLWALAVWL